MKVYNKLVRDLIPEVIKATGKNCDIEVAAKFRFNVEIR